MATEQTAYLIPSGHVETEIEIKKSRFIARACAVNNREEALAFVDTAKRDYPDARHHCWAYLIGHSPASQNAAMSDDGEPSGTAGKPILNVLQHSDMGNVLIVVIRYFGGIKLGAGGLVRAYSNAAQAALTLLPTTPHIPSTQCVISAPFSQEQAIRHWLRGHEGQMVTVNYTDTVSCTVTFPTSEIEGLHAQALAKGWCVHDE